MFEMKYPFPNKIIPINDSTHHNVILNKIGVDKRSPTFPNKHLYNICDCDNKVMVKNVIITNVYNEE